MPKKLLVYILYISVFLTSQLLSQDLYRSNPSGFGGSGNWSTATNWEVSTNSGVSWSTASSAPNTNTDLVTIQANHSITLDTDPTIKDLTIESNGELHNSTSTLYGIFIYGNLTVTGILGSSTDNIALAFDRNDGGTSTISGAGTIALQYIAKLNNTACTVSITNATVSLYKSGSAVYNSSTGNSLTLSMSGGTLNLTNGGLSSTDMSYSFSGGTVKYSLSGSQTVLGTTYNNLTLASSGTKTLSANTSVNGTFSLEGTAAFSSSSFTLTYGGSSLLKYAGSSSQLTTSQEFTNGVINLTIANTNGVTLDVSRSISGNFTLNSATSFNDNGKTLTVNGNFSNSGTHSGSGKILLSGTSSAISGAGTFKNIEVNGTNTSNSGNGTFSGSFIHSGGTFTNTGTMTFASGITITRSSGSASNFVNSGTFSYSGTINLNYTGIVTTGAEVPNSSTVLNNVQNFDA